jgi:hypothetical protein
MNEYSDQLTWFELWGWDGFQWEFIADFDTRDQAHRCDEENDFGYDETRIKRVFGTL